MKANSKDYCTRSTAEAAAIVSNQGVFTKEAEGGIGKIITPAEARSNSVGDVIWWFKPRTSHNHPVEEVVDGWNDIKAAEKFVNLLEQIPDGPLKKQIFAAKPAHDACVARVFAQNFSKLKEIARGKSNPLVRLERGGHKWLVTKGGSDKLLRKMGITG